MASVEREELTAEERFWIQRFHGCTHIDKALRLLDAHAADRAALVAQLEAARAALRNQSACEAEIEALENKAKAAHAAWEGCDARWKESESKLVTMRARVHELTRERDEARATSERDAAYDSLESANALLARAQDERSKRPRDANADAGQLDYDISKHLERNGWQWDAINRQWRPPSAEPTETATWTEFRGREQ